MLLIKHAVYDARSPLKVVELSFLIDKYNVKYIFQSVCLLSCTWPDLHFSFYLDASRGCMTVIPL